MGTKGSWQRRKQVSEEEFKRNWDRAFKKVSNPTARKPLDREGQPDKPRSK